MNQSIDNVTNDQEIKQSNYYVTMTEADYLVTFVRYDDLSGSWKTAK